MLGIFAHTFMTATRTGNVDARPVPPKTRTRKKWLPTGHWWLDTPLSIDPNKL